MSGENGSLSGPGYGWGIALLAAAWIAMLVCADSFLAQRSLSESRSDAAAGNFAAASERAADAVALQPWAAEPRLQAALAAEAEGRLPDARHEALEATDRAPQDWAAWLARARIEVRSGDIAAGRASLARARSLNPRSPLLAAPVPPLLSSP